MGEGDARWAMGRFLRDGRVSLRGPRLGVQRGQGGEQCRGRASACPALHEGMAWRGSRALQAAFEQYRRSLGAVCGSGRWHSTRT